MARSRSESRGRDLDLEPYSRKRRHESRSRSPTRKRRYDSRSPGPRRSRAEPRDGRSYREADRRSDRPRTRDSSPAKTSSDVAKQPVAAPVAEVPRERPALKAGPAGGAYIPPFKLAQMMREANDKLGPQYQRMTWDALRKSLNGLINKINVKNIKDILPEIFSENLIRGRGVFCRSMMKSQLASPTFTPTYAALVAIINTKFPEIGELLLKRVISQFLKAFKRNDKNMAVGCLKFIAHLCNQQVAHEALALEILVLLLDSPTDDSVEVALEFASDVAALLEEASPASFTMVQSSLRTILQEGTLQPRTQMLIQNFFSAVSYGVIDPDSAKEKARVKQQEDNRRLGFPDRPVHGLPPRIPVGLDLVDAQDARCHNYDLDSPLDRETGLDIFKADPEYEKHEAEYKAIKDEILGKDESGEEDDDGGDEGGESDSEEEEEQAQQNMAIQDQTQTNLINLRRTIYLTIMSSAQFEEAGHKLMKIQLASGQEIEVVTMLIECCSQEKTYINYYGHLSQRFCNINRIYQELFEECFRKQYGLIHRLETNKLRNVARLFAHLLTTDAISWSVLVNIRLTEDDTTSSSRIFIKILFQDLSENMGLLSLNMRLQEPTLQMYFEGIFPKDTPRNMRFSINFFTSIGLGGLTDRMREHLKNLPRLIATQQAEQASSSSSSSSDTDSSSSSDSSSSGSSSDSSSDSSSSDSSSSDDEDEAAPQHKQRLPPPPKLPANGSSRRSARGDAAQGVQHLSIDKERSRGGPSAYDAPHAAQERNDNRSRQDGHVQDERGQGRREKRSAAYDDESPEDRRRGDSYQRQSRDADKYDRYVGQEDDRYDGSHGIHDDRYNGSHDRHDDRYNGSYDRHDDRYDGSDDRRDDRYDGRDSRRDEGSRGGRRDYESSRSRRGDR